MNLLLALIATDVPLNPDNTIVVKNKHPASWSGRMFDVGVYKDRRLLVTQPQISVGDQAMIVLKPILYFGVTRLDSSIPRMFKSSEIAEITDALTSFDLSNYPNGLKVILKENADEKFTTLERICNQFSDIIISSQQ